MEQVFNPLLGKMTVDDLNQRYADSFVMYGGQPRYISGFRVDGDGNVQIDHQEINTGFNKPKSVFDPFEWSKLNVARPTSGWYIYPGDNPSYFFLTYPNKKQYRRGLHARNTHLFVPQFMAPTSGCYFKAALQDEAPLETINDEVIKTKRTVIPRRDRLFLWVKNAWNFYVRSYHVATVDNGFVLLHHPKFWQELKEVNHSGLLQSFDVKEEPAPKKSRNMGWEVLLDEIEAADFDPPLEEPRDIPQPEILRVDDRPVFNVRGVREWADLGNHLMAHYINAHVTRHELNRNVLHPPLMQTYYDTDIGHLNVELVPGIRGNGKVRFYVLNHDYYNEVVADATERIERERRNEEGERTWLMYIGNFPSPLHRAKIYKASVIGYRWGMEEYGVSICITREDL